jgi:hypothetical protein
MPDQKYKFHLSRGAEPGEIFSLASPADHGCVDV